MKRLIWLAPLLIIVFSLSIVSCKKDDGPVVPITLKVSTPDQIPVKNDMSFKAHFILNGKVSKSLDVKIGDNKIEVPRANYSNVIVTSHDFFDYSKPSTDAKYPELLTSPVVSAFLPYFTTRFILHGEMPIDFTNKNEATIQLQSSYTLVMVKRNDAIAIAPYFLYYGNNESFKQVTDDKGQEWLAMYYINKVIPPNTASTAFNIGIKWWDNGKTMKIPVIKEIQPSTVMQFTFDRYAGFTTETFAFKDYDHVNVMSTTHDWVLY
ncbi:hypothetical protein ACR78Z_12210 [Sphingobacterium thalpophilum]|uniref:hypothetical protein n=1 Tax=Sphingobacterium thalpophilum TaxID=259 RepID=UPI003DA467D6